jgi:hypothetical protein
MDYKHAIVKFNHSQGALLCNGCGRVLANGLHHPDKERFCESCTKPHKGRICNVKRQDYRGGYYYVCQFLDHPEFAATTYFRMGTKRFGHTSMVIKDATDEIRHSKEGIEIETLNTRYTIVEDPNVDHPSQLRPLLIR